MSLISLIIALLLEQWRPLADRKYLVSCAARYASFLQQHFNAGESRHGMIACMLGVLPVTLAAIAVYYLLHYLSPLLALAFNVLILYLTMGFRQVSHYFTGIHWALKGGDLDKARAILGQWRGASCERLSVEEVVRLRHRRGAGGLVSAVFAVVFWFVLRPQAADITSCRRSAPPLTDSATPNWLFGSFSPPGVPLLD
jgi:adenosylcobinamide-phosphate synthase